MKDTDWFRIFEKSPQKARSMLVNEYANLVYAIVLSKLKGIAAKEDIDDCVSDVFVEIFCSIQNYSEEKGTLKSFISTIAARVAINSFRRIMRRKSSTYSIDDEDTLLPVSEENTEEDVQKSLLHKRLWDIVDSLGEPDSTIIVYQYCYEFTVNEIAKKLSMSPAAVQKRSIRARKRIKKFSKMKNTLRSDFNERKKL